MKSIDAMSDIIRLLLGVFILQFSAVGSSHGDELYPCRGQLRCLDHG